MRRGDANAFSRVVAAALALGLGAEAEAVDGVLEINQTCAVNTGCFAGDTAGFPVTITAAGGYRLTGNLTVPNENTTAITVNPPAPAIDGIDVILDLNGFSVVGPTECSGVPVDSCTPLGSGEGIISGISVAIHDGFIRGMGSHGVRVGAGSLVENVQAVFNGGEGIHVAGNSIVRNSRARSNGDIGIYAGTGSNVLDNALMENRGTGIQCEFSGCTITGNSLYTNGGTGIDAGGTSTVVRNTLQNNAGDGITCGAQACLVSGNTVVGSGGVGLVLGTSTGYVNNVLFANGGTVSGGVQLGANLCNFTTTCP